eukprot:221103_1
MSDSQFINKGIEFIKQAVAHDNKEEYAEALGLYQRGVEYLMTGLKYEKNPRAKETVTEKVKKYLSRAEELKVHLAEPAPAKKKNKKAKASGGGGDDDDGKDSGDEETDKLKGQLSSAIVVEKPNVKWSDVAGLETAKDMLKEAVILPIKFPQLFTGKRTPWRGILLYGPPGTGKSFLAKAVATEANNSTFFSVSSSDLVSKFLGESERLVRNLFEMARARAPAIIFIDEIDSLCGSRSDGENDSARRIKTEFLVQMQGVGKSNDSVLVLGATNTPWGLDPAIRRRFEKRIYIQLPESEARKVMFKIHVGDTPNNLKEEEFTRLGDNTDGFSGSDISVVVRDALYEPVRTMQSATHFKKIPNPDNPSDFFYQPCSPGDRGAEEHNLMDLPSEKVQPLDLQYSDFVRALQHGTASVGPEDIKRHIEWTADYGQEG